MAVYLDCAATAPVDPRVRAAVLRYLDEEFGNAGSRTHAYGQRARRAVEQARQQVAAVVGASRGDVIFTSGATEANNLAILGLADAIARDVQGRGARPRPAPDDTAVRERPAKGLPDGSPTGLPDGLPNRGGDRLGHVVTTAIEHHAVLEPIRELERRGFGVTVISPRAGEPGRTDARTHAGLATDAGGWVDPRDVMAAIEPDTVLVSVMHVNNETGVIQPIEEIAALLADRACALHVDAAQGFGKALAALRHPRIDLISVSGHKLGAPKGIGALIARRPAHQPMPHAIADAARSEAGPLPLPAMRGEDCGEGRSRPTLSPLMFGGGQERGLRPGTLPVHLIVGFGLAAELAVAEHDERQARCRAFRDRLLAGLAPLAPIVNGDRARTLPGIVNLTIPGVEADAAIEAWRDLAAISNGAACTSQSQTCSHVLSAMRLDPRRAEGALRFSWTHDSTLPDLPRMVAAIAALRAPHAGAHVA